MTIAETRDVMQKELDTDGFIMLHVPKFVDAPNKYRIIKKRLEESLYPLNKKNDVLSGRGWQGVIYSNILRSWLIVTPNCVMDVEVYQDKLMIMADDTIATFKFTPIRKIDLFVLVPLEYNETH